MLDPGTTQAHGLDESTLSPAEGTVLDPVIVPVTGRPDEEGKKTGRGGSRENGRRGFSVGTGRVRLFPGSATLQDWIGQAENEFAGLRDVPMTSKEQILAAIRRLASETGAPPGTQRFETETGVREHEWGKYWARWGDALTEAGFKPNDWISAYPEEELLERLATFAKEIGHFPVTRELRLKANSDSTFPSPGPFKRLGGQRALASKLREYAQSKGYEDVVTFCDALVVKESTLATSNNDAPELKTGFVYLMKSGRHYKIGRTVSVGSRERQLAIQIPIAPTIVHRIETDDPVGVEAYWHKRFEDKRGEGEWFALSAEDVKAFKRWKKIV